MRRQNFMVHMCNTIIESLGVYLPPKVVSTEDVLRGCKHKILFPLERLTGIQSRRMAGETEFSIDLARKAIEDCLANSKYNPEHVDLLICCNISRYDGPNFRVSFEPSTSIKLKKHFGFNNAMAFDITNACAGMWTGVMIVNAFLSLEMIQCGMVVSGEYITHLTRSAQNEIEGFMDPQLACLTLGDAGAAIILERAPNQNVGFHEIRMHTQGRYSPYCIARVTDKEHGGAVMLTDAIKLTGVTLQQAIMHTDYMQNLSEWSFDSFQHLIMHQTSRMTIENAKQEINKFYHKNVCHEGNVVNNLAERGNTASTSYFVALKDFILKDRIKSGDNLLFSITGSGLTVGTAFYTLDDLPDRLRHTEVTKERPQKMAGEGRKSAVPLLPTVKVRIESVGIMGRVGAGAGKSGEDALVAAHLGGNSVGMVKGAAENCLAKSSYSQSDIDLLIYAGVYRDDFICEPAIASLVAGSLKMNDAPESQEDKKTLAFDIFNGAIGFLNACYVATRMIAAGKAKKAMVVASEIENNAKTRPTELLGIMETGSAVILDESSDGKTGFGNFVFKYFPDYIEALTSYTKQQGGKTWIHCERDINLETYYLQCIRDAVHELLSVEQLDISQIKVIFPPQISSQFVANLSDEMNLSRDKFVDIAHTGHDLYTSSLAYALQHVREQHLVRGGDIGLIINVGSGIQVGCATYYF
jgi:3-oxoacyl-[acyl-carrier-protein] synthase III